MLLLLAALSPVLGQTRYSSSSNPQGPPCCDFCCCGFPLVFGLVGVGVGALVYVPLIIGMWKAFDKAGEPGWAALIPIYNCMVAAKISGRPEAHGLLVLIPFGVGIVFWVIICVDIAKSFGHEAGFGVGLGLLGPVFWAILGFGESRYIEPAYEGGEFGYERKRRRRRRDDDYEDEDDGDRSRRRRDEEDDYDDDRPRSRRDSRRSRREEDEDED